MGIGPKNAFEGIRSSGLNTSRRLRLGGLVNHCPPPAPNLGETGPWTVPLEPDDWFDPDRITYFYRTNSLYNWRFEQRKRLKGLLGRHRPLMEKAKYAYHTKAIILGNLTAAQANAIRRILHIEPDVFWLAYRGKAFLDLPTTGVQLELPFE